jgi:biopolymer transport protein ExbD
MPTTVQQQPDKPAFLSSGVVSVSVLLAACAAVVACGDPNPPEVVAELTVSADGEYALEGSPVSSPLLAQALKDLRAAQPDIQLRIAADGRASHQSVVGVVQAASAAGIGRLRFASAK